MNILSLDTSGRSISCAVMRDGEIVSLLYARCGLTHSETLMPAVDEALARASLAPKDIDIVGCVTGPGSFTGVRIGVCAAKGFAHAAGIRCVGVDSLEAIAWGLRMSRALIVPMLDARRHEVYAAAFRANAGGLKRVLPDTASPLGAFLDTLPRGEDMIFAGDGSRAMREEILAAFPQARIAPDEFLWPRGDSVCSLAMLRADEATGPEGLSPLYLRAPQAVREKEARNG